MRKAISAAALILALTCSARAGWMPNGEEPPPPPPDTTAQESASTDEDATGVTDTLTEIVLAALVSVLP